jgi:hypothetical protein
LFAALPFAASAEKRVALVIGNGAYQFAPKLKNPSGDATSVANLFKSAGFEAVLARSDAGNLEFKRSLRELLEAAHDADIAVLFYAGHGIQIGDENYMVPVDARLAREYDAKDEAISLERIVEALEPAKRLRLVILDACRDNPFIVNMQRRVASRGLTRGLARVEPTQVDTLVAYAAKAGSTATDGESDHSPFTKALLRHLAEPGLDIRLAFGRVRDDVLKSTKGDQEPFVYGSLGGSNISLVPPPAVPKPAPLADISADFNLVEKINSRMAWEVFINTHKSGILVDVARRKLESLQESQPGAAASNPKVAALPPEKKPGAPAADETKAWNEAKDSGDRAALLAFIQRYPSSSYVARARQITDELEQAAREKEKKARAEREAARQREEEARRAKAEADRQKAEREAAQAKAAAEEAERKRVEQQRAAEAEAAERARRAEADRQKAERELALAKAVREKAEAERKKAEQEATLAKAAEAEAERKRKAEADRQKAEREARLAKAAREKAEADRQQAEREAAAAKAAEAEAERKRQAEADRLKAEQEAARAKAAREETARKQQGEICSREEKTLAALRTSIAHASGRDELGRFRNALTCERLRPAVVALQAEAERLKEAEAVAEVQIRAAQQELRRLGCYAGAEDGKLQTATKDAIRRYYAASGRPVTTTDVSKDLVDELTRAPGDRCVESAKAETGKKTEKKQASRPARRDSEETRPQTTVRPTNSAPRVMTGVGF